MKKFDNNNNNNNNNNDNSNSRDPDYTYVGKEKNLEVKKESSLPFFKVFKKNPEPVTAIFLENIATYKNITINELKALGEKCSSSPFKKLLNDIADDYKEYIRGVRHVGYYYHKNKETRSKQMETLDLNDDDLKIKSKVYEKMDFFKQIFDSTMMQMMNQEREAVIERLDSSKDALGSNKSKQADVQELLTQFKEIKNLDEYPKFFTAVAEKNFHFYNKPPAIKAFNKFEEFYYQHLPSNKPTSVVQLNNNNADVINYKTPSPKIASKGTLN